VLSAGLMGASLAACAQVGPTPDGELIPSTEAQDTAAMISAFHAQIQKRFDTEGHAFRGAHRKAHGCVQSTFSVLPNLPLELAQGLFAKARTYNAVIRFSNGSADSQDDHSGDARGMAIKIMGVAGPKLLSDEASASTQDFVMMNSPVFFIRDAAGYVVFQKAIDGGGLATAGWFIRHLFHEAGIVMSIRNRIVLNPLDAQYWSTTPSRLGSGAMKFSAKPCVNSAAYMATSDSHDRLRENLEGQLAGSGACFDFMVQARTNPDTMPIEDPTVEWPEAQSPFVTVARVQIPAQVPESGLACEVRSFTPWHSIPEHRPLGGISRVRKALYLDASTLRHRLNGQERNEP
jgi:hypothetical protein